MSYHNLLVMLDCRKEDLVFFVIVDHHFVTLCPICIGFFFPLFFLIVCFCFFFGLSCVLICHVLLMDGFPSLIFICKVFLLIWWKPNPRLKAHELNLSVCCIFCL